LTNLPYGVICINGTGSSNKTEESQALIAKRSSWSPWELHPANPNMTIKAGESDKSAYGRGYKAPVFPVIEKKAWNAYGW